MKGIVRARDRPDPILIQYYIKIDKVKERKIMNKFKIKVFSMITAVICILSSIPAISVSAATTWPTLSTSSYMKVYTISEKNNTPVYSSSSLKSKVGTIYATDEIYVYKMTNTYGYVSYPITGSNKRKYGYIKTSVITANNKSHVTTTANAKVTTYKRAGNNAAFGYTEKGDYIMAVSSSGAYTQIVYSLTGCGNAAFKLGWVKTADYNKYLASSSSNATNKSSSSNNVSSKRQAIVNCALGQVGVSDYKGNNNVTYNKWYYGRMVSGSGYAWCSAFVSWCANQAGVSTSVIPKTASCSSAVNYFKKKGAFHMASSGYTPKTGDLVYYTEGGRISHVGIIVASPVNGYLQVVEGNVRASNGNYSVTYFTKNSKRKIGSSYIYGYASPSY